MGGGGWGGGGGGALLFSWLQPKPHPFFIVLFSIGGGLFRVYRTTPRASILNYTVLSYIHLRLTWVNSLLSHKPGCNLLMDI